MAIWTMDERYAPAFGESGNIGHPIPKTGGQDQFPCRMRFAGLGVDFKPCRGFSPAHGHVLEETNRFIPQYLVLADECDFPGRTSVLGEEVVRVWCLPVTRLAAVDNEYVSQ